MGFLDTLRGRPTEQRQQESVGSLDALESEQLPPGSSSSELLSEELPSTSGGGAFGGAGGFGAGSGPEAVQRLYNPYEGLSKAIDGSRGVYMLPAQPEFLFSEEALVHRRSWSENLTYYTGSGYLTGALLGGSQGALTAVRTRPEGAVPNTARLQLNRLLNLSGKTGRSAGNALGALGLFFASSESFLGYLSADRIPFWADSVGAGFFTGALFRSTRGPRAAVVAGLVGAVAGGALVTARNTLNKNL